MRKTLGITLMMLLAAIAATTSLAQVPAASAPINHYKADFVVKEVDANGHVVNSRSFSTILAATNSGATNQIRSGDKVPVRTSSDEKGEAKYQYIDVGVNIDCRSVSEVDRKLAMSVTAEVSSAPPGSDSNSILGPLIRQFKWNSDIIVTPGTPTTIFSSDDVGGKTKVQVELTATLIK